MSTLSKRIVSAIVMLNVFGGALLFDSALFIVLILFVGMVAAKEWVFLVMPQVRERQGFSTFLIIILAAIAVLFPSLNLKFLPEIEWPVKILVTSFIGIVIWSIDVQIMGGKCGKDKCRSRQFMLLGLVYISLSIASLLWLYSHENASEFLRTNDGIYLTLLVCSMVWATDICAYFTGKAIGGPKMAPKISPNKTIAGLFGGMVGAAIVAVIFGLPKFSIELFTDVPLYCMALMGALLAVVGQIGDLMVSALKRKYKVKDTGNIIPGHGGILDRIDGLLLVSLVFTVIVMILEII